MTQRTRPLWRIRPHLLWCRACAWIAGEPPEHPRYELHQELAELYTELADAYWATGDEARAKIAQAEADHHWLMSRPPGLPPAASAVMPSAAAGYSRTDARGTVPPN